MATEYAELCDIVQLISQDVPLKRVASTDNGEWAGPCLFCGGTDRFRVWPNSARPHYWCRVCERSGDAIQYFVEQGYTFREACDKIGATPDRPRMPYVAPQVDCVAPPEAWSACAESFVSWAQEKLFRNAQMLDYLYGRGLKRTTIEQARLGYNPQTLTRSRGKWGLAADKSYGDSFWLPDGIVIPAQVDGVIWKVQIRKGGTVSKGMRYKTVTGSANALYLADSIVSEKPCMLTEGPFDALSVQQEAGDLIGVGACGTSGARRGKWFMKVQSCPDTLISLDDNEPGDHAAEWWQETIHGARRWKPLHGDPSQMLQDGMDVRAWVRSGLGEVEPSYTFAPNEPRRPSRPTPEEIPTLLELARNYLADPKSGEKVNEQTGEVTCRRSWRHFAECVCAMYQEYTLDAARLAYKQEQQRLKELEKVGWRRFFLKLNAMSDQELIDYVAGRARAALTELVDNTKEQEEPRGNKFDAHLYETRLKCAKRQMERRKLTMPVKEPQQPIVRARKPKKQKAVDSNTQSPLFDVQGMVDRLHERNQQGVNV